MHMMCLQLDLGIILLANVIQSINNYTRVSLSHRYLIVLCGFRIAATFSEQSLTLPPLAAEWLPSALVSRVFIPSVSIGSLFFSGSPFSTYSCVVGTSVFGRVAESFGR
jgi:hypothetical protein